MAAAAEAELVAAGAVVDIPLMLMRVPAYHFVVLATVMMSTHPGPGATPLAPRSSWLTCCAGAKELPLMPARGCRMLGRHADGAVEHLIGLPEPCDLSTPAQH